MTKGCCEVAAMFGQVCLDCNPVKRTRRKTVLVDGVARPVLKNLCGKTVKRADAYEVWQAGSWTWYVLKKWQADDDKPFARWFCDVVTPIVPQGEMGDVYVAEIKRNARRVK